jgi:hypothetical protein
LPKPVRRIVTGHNAEGRSVFRMDGPAPDVYPAPASAAMTISLLWRTTTSPASNDGREDMAPAGLRVPTAPQQRGGTVFRIADLPPETGQIADFALGPMVPEAGLTPIIFLSPAAWRLRGRAQ